MEVATAPYILRSIYKDDHVSETQVTRPATELMTSLVGARFTNRYDAAICSASRSLYTFFSLMQGQTLGEEFCEMLPVARGTPWHTIGMVRKVLLALLQGVEPSVLFYGAKYFMPSIAPHDVIANVSRIVMCLLFLFESYGTIPHRLLRIRFLSLKPSQMLSDGDGARGTYFTLGLVVLVELVVRLWRFSRTRRVALEEKQRDDGVASESSDENDEAAVQGRCMLCLSHRKNPAATLCGHIYCWSCIAEWISSSPRDAVCPFCRQHITTQSLVPLYFYVAKEGPTVGTAEEA